MNDSSKTILRVKIKHQIWLSALLILIVFLGKAQTTVDSLQRLIDNEVDSRRKVELLNQLSFAFFDSDVEKADESTQLALQLSQKIEDRKGEGWATAYRGVYFLFTGQLKMSQEYFTKSLELSRKIEDHNLQAYSLNQLGNVFRDKGVFDSAYQFYQRAESYLKQNPDPYYLSVVKMNRSRYFLILSKPDSALFEINEALRLRESMNDLSMLPDVWILLGNCYREKYELEKAQHYYNRARSAVTLASNVNRQYLVSIGEIYFIKGDFENALKSWTEALAYNRKLNYKYEVANLLYRMGKVFEWQGYYDLAVNYLSEALNISNKAPYNFLKAQVVFELAWVYYRNNNLPLAIENISRAAVLFNRANSMYFLAEYDNLKGHILLKENKFDSALYYHNRCLKVMEELDNPVGISFSLFNLGEVYSDKEQWHKALHLFRKGLEIDRSIGDQYGISYDYNRIGYIYTKLSRYDSAELFFKESLRIAVTSSSSRIISDNYYALANLYRAKGDLNESISYYDEYIQMKDSLHNTHTAQSLAAYQILYNVEKNEQQIELLNKDNQLRKAENQKQKAFLYTSLAASIILILLAGFYYRFSKIQKKLNISLVEKNDVILLKNNELLDLNIEKNNLIGVVAHDLKSPLNQIKGLVSVIKLSPCAIDGETTGYIQMIENSASRLTNMIGKILDVQAIDSKQLNITFEAVNFSEMMKSVADRFSIEAQRKQIQLHSAIADNVMVNVDRSYTEEVIENLLSNAIKFSPSDKNIYINITSNDNAALCEIRDEGPGLSEDDKKKLFGKYQRLSATPTGNESSTGLGLSIVKKFVDAMKGEIWCESEVDKGASFFVRFELAKS